jgi:ribosomal protein S12 methylthiotransferase accessory factor
VTSAPPDILDFRERLVSDYCGLVRKFSPVHKDVTEPARPFIWRAEIANHRFLDTRHDAMVVASGKAFDPADAQRSALGEAIERYCGLRSPDVDTVLASRAELEGDSLDPEKLVLHTEAQREALGFARYTPDCELQWVRGKCPRSGASLWMPAQSVSLAPPSAGAVLFQATSNGMAAGISYRETAAKALLEVIEREAFLAAWYHRLHPRRIDWRTHPDTQVVGMGEAYARRGVTIECYLLPTDHGIPVVAGLAIESPVRSLAVVVGLGADLSLSRALRSAMLEVGQVRPALRIKLRDPVQIERRATLVADPAQVSTLEDHDLLYTDKAMLRAFAMWRDGHDEPLSLADWEEPEDRSLERLLDRIDTTGCRAAVCDITAPEIRKMGFWVLSGVIEDFQPIHFGEKEFRGGGIRFYEIPRLLGLRPDRVSAADLNPLPHPLS